MPDRVIESHGQWQWSLVISDGEVAARCGVPYDGVLTYSTKDRPNRADKTSEYQLDVQEVVERYVDESETDATVDELLARVRAALEEVEDARE